MAPRLPSLLEPPIAFAHRGASARAPENTIEAFVLALRLGATGLETDAWLTADGEVVLDHDGVVRSGLRRRPVGDVARAALPAHVPTLGEVLDAVRPAVGTSVPLSIDVKDGAAAAPLVAVLREAGHDLSVVHLCSASWEEAATWRTLDPDLRLVHSTRLRRMKRGAERHAATVTEAGIDVVNMPEGDWSGGLTTLFHRFDRLAFAWGAVHLRRLAALLDMGMDAVYCDHADRLADALAGRGAAGRQ